MYCIIDSSVIFEKMEQPISVPIWVQYCTRGYGNFCSFHRTCKSSFPPNRKPMYQSHQRGCLLATILITFSSLNRKSLPPSPHQLASTLTTPIFPTNPARTTENGFLHSGLTRNRRSVIRATNVSAAFTKAAPTETTEHPGASFGTASVPLTVLDFAKCTIASIIAFRALATAFALPRGGASVHRAAPQDPVACLAHCAAEGLHAVCAQSCRACRVPLQVARPLVATWCLGQLQCAKTQPVRPGSVLSAFREGPGRLCARSTRASR